MNFIKNDVVLEKKPKIIVDVERMKHPFTGLYFYCKNLAINLQKYHSDKFDFYFFTYPKVKFPGFLKKINRSQLDKFYLYKPGYHLWHSTWQDTKYVPTNHIKFVYTIHDLNFLYTDKPQKKKEKLLAAVQEKINRADAITVISEFVKKDIEKNLDLKGKEIHVIYNGVEVNEYPHFDKPPYRPSSKFIFTVGTVLYKKHFHILPRLLQGNDFELVIGGIHPDKSYIGKIWSEAEKYGVSERVHLTGALSDEEKYWYMKNCEVFVFPSISEGFGLPPIEAMRLGKPVILSTYTSLPEIGGDKAYYFENFDAEHMQQVLYKALDDYYTHNRKEDIIKWSKKFTWQESTKQYIAVYQKTLGLPISTQPIQEKRKKITAIIPTYNEENNITEAIEQVNWADEVLVIDSYSTDKTVEIAKSMNAKVIQRKFDNYSEQKNFAIEQAKYDWIFVLDADERITEDLKLELIDKLYNEGDEKAFWIPRENYFLNRKVRFSGWQNDKVIRLFNRKFAKYNGKLVHEEVYCQTKTGYLKSVLKHYTYKSYSDYLNKIKKYSHLKALELFQKNIKPRFYYQFFKPYYRFVYHYFINFGFLDGKIGWTIAKINAIGMKERYRILKKLYQEKNTNKKT